MSLLGVLAHGVAAAVLQVQIHWLLVAAPRKHVPHLCVVKWGRQRKARGQVLVLVLVLVLLLLSLLLPTSCGRE